jgi:hypothetical protein
VCFYEYADLFFATKALSREVFFKIIKENKLPPALAGGIKFE